VSGWWSGGGKLATNTPITISDGTNSITVRVNQKQGVADWRELLSGFELNGSTLTVTVSNDADGRVVADAFRVERIGDLSATPQLGDDSESSFFDVADDRQAAFANGRGNAGTVIWGFPKADHIHATGEWASHHQGETNPFDWWQDSDSSAGRSAHEHVFANSDWQFELDRVEIGFLDS